MTASAHPAPSPGTGPEPVADGQLTAPLDVPSSGTITVAFLISAGAEVVDFAGPWGVFDAVMIGDEQRKPFTLYTVAADHGPVCVSGGLQVVPNHDVTDAPAPDVVVVPAVHTDTLSPDALAWLQRVHDRTAVTMSVCNGSLVLGLAGLLDGRSATAHHHGYALLQAMFPQVSVVRGVRYVEDGRVCTAGGLTSGIDLALRVVERYFGRRVAEATATMLEYQGTGWMYPHSNAGYAVRPVDTAEQAVCPVCDMQAPKQTSPTRQHAGVAWYFCCEGCADLFASTPDRFVTAP